MTRGGDPVEDDGCPAARDDGQRPRTSTVTASPGSTWRTAAVSTLGSPASVARPAAGRMPKGWPGCPRARRAYHLDDHTTSGQQADPLMQQCACPVRTARQQGLAHIQSSARAGPPEPALRSPGRWHARDELCAADRSPPFTAEVGLGHQTTQPTPTGPRGEPRALTECQHRDPGCRGSTSAPPLTGLTRPARIRWAATSWVASAHSQIHPKHRSDTGLVAGLHETHAPIESVTIGQPPARAGPVPRHVPPTSPGSMRRNATRIRRDVQVGKSITHVALATAMNSGSGRS